MRSIYKSYADTTKLLCQAGIAEAMTDLMRDILGVFSFGLCCFLCEEKASGVQVLKLCTDRSLSVGLYVRLYARLYVSVCLFVCPRV